MANTAKQHTVTHMSDVLQTLEDMARDQKDELKTKLTDGYENLRDILKEVPSNISSAIKDSSDNISLFVNRTGKAAKEEAARVARTVDRQAHRSPWPFIASAAICGIAAGYFLRKRS